MPKQQPKLFKILLLEDDLEVCSRLLLALHRMEPRLAPYDLDLTLLSTSEAVEQLINAHPERKFDVVLMDRDCKMNASFHILDLNLVGLENVISISSTPMWNQQASYHGVVHCEPKSFNDLGGFADRTAEKVYEILQKMPSGV